MNPVEPKPSPSCTAEKDLFCLTYWRDRKSFYLPFLLQYSPSSNSSFLLNTCFFIAFFFSSGKLHVSYRLNVTLVLTKTGENRLCNARQKENQRFFFFEGWLSPPSRDLAAVLTLNHPNSTYHESCTWFEGVRACSTVWWKDHSSGCREGWILI